MAFVASCYAVHCVRLESSWLHSAQLLDTFTTPIEPYYSQCLLYSRNFPYIPLAFHSHNVRLFDWLWLLHSHRFASVRCVGLHERYCRGDLFQSHRYRRAFVEHDARAVSSLQKSYRSLAHNRTVQPTPFQFFVSADVRSFVSGIAAVACFNFTGIAAR